MFCKYNSNCNNFIDMTVEDYNLVILEKDKIIENISNELDIIREEYNKINNFFNKYKLNINSLMNFMEKYEFRDFKDIIIFVDRFKEKPKIDDIPVDNNTQIEEYPCKNESCPDFVNTPDTYCSDCIKDVIICKKCKNSFYTDENKIYCLDCSFDEDTESDGDSDKEDDINTPDINKCSYCNNCPFPSNMLGTIIFDNKYYNVCESNKVSLYNKLINEKNKDEEIKSDNSISDDENNEKCKKSDRNGYFKDTNKYKNIKNKMIKLLLINYYKRRYIKLKEKEKTEKEIKRNKKINDIILSIKNVKNININKPDNDILNNINDIGINKLNKYKLMCNLYEKLESGGITNSRLFTKYIKNNKLDEYTYLIYDNKSRRLFNKCKKLYEIKEFVDLNIIINLRILDKIFSLEQDDFKILKEKLDNIMNIK